MRTFSCTSLLFCSLSVFISCSEFTTVEVQSGDRVTLLCSNYASSPSTILWFCAGGRSTLSSIASIHKPSSPAVLSEGFQDGRLTVKSNLSHIFLTIDPVNSSDSGLYFCGYRVGTDPVLKSPTYLDVQEEVLGAVLVPPFGGLVVFHVVVVFGLALKIARY